MHCNEGGKLMEFTFVQEVVSIMTCIIIGFFPGLLIGATYHEYIIEEDEDEYILEDE